ncbi:hypothetical protein GLW08_05805 [Pontibacillus yanchengensis]|uniref:Uncharacterized protein n=2 Tax=Pontibacillus yanchengensis TaxID=462910 RepID=A0ACC7VDV0_9BACI|nr:YppF family protein [Pontibacillus yanchengensis]MYL32270.1 hypothetical protein [Pontibacillus yanchengensis]MYL52850.1 hypothetical protein [Pontibacillus yanchengensis]
MRLVELSHAYKQEKGHEAETADQLLDYCQQLYIKGEIDYPSYRSLFQRLHEKGAESSHSETELV